MPNLPATTDPKLLAALPRMQPLSSVEPDGSLRSWVLAEPGHNYLVYTLPGEAVRFDLPPESATATLFVIDPRTGRPREGSASPVERNGRQVVLPAGSGTGVYWLRFE